MLSVLMRVCGWEEERRYEEGRRRGRKREIRGKGGEV
jgi:hypothetical protein